MIKGRMGSILMALSSLIWVILMGCRLDDNRLRGHIKIPPNDFLRTEILTSGPVPADGSSELVLVIHLKNSNHRPVVGYRPSYEVVSGIGVVESECSESDANGASICVLKSWVPGEKVLALVNALVGLEKTIYFENPVKKLATVGVTSGAKTELSSEQGYFAEITAGDPTQGVLFQTEDGHSGVISLQYVVGF